MSNRKKITMVLEAVDKYSSQFKEAANATKGYAKIAKKVSEQQRNINKKIGDISAYKKLNKNLDDTGYNLKIASRRSVELAKKLRGVKRPTALMTSEFRAASKAEDKLRRSHVRQSGSLNKLQRELKEAKIDTSNLTKATKFLERQQASANRQMKFGKAADRVRSGVKSGASKARNIAGKATVTGAATAGAAGYFFKREFITTAAAFEKYNTQLETLQGSNEEARKAMAWVKEFTTKTPFELAGVMDAFVRARAFGLDPMNGTMQAIADQTSKLGGGQQELQSIVLALGQAWQKQKLQGEEALQLVERGVPVWDLMSEALGKSTAEIVKMSSKGQLGRKEINLLIKAMGKNAAGAATKQMKTWNGMVSNLADHWVNFKLAVMDAGLFDKMSNTLKTLLTRIDKMVGNGEFEAKARKFSEALSKLFDAAGKAGKAIYQFTIWASEHTTMIGNVIKGYAAYKLVSMASAASAALFGNSLLALSAKSIPAAIASLGKLAVAQRAASMGGVGKLAKLGIAGAATGGVALAGAGGYAAGTAIHKNFLAGTKVSDKIGSGVAHLLAALGNDEAQQAVAMNKRSRALEHSKNGGLKLASTPRVGRPGRGRTTNVVQHNTINVQASKEMNEEQLANKIITQIERKESQARNRRTYD